MTRILLAEDNVTFAKVLGFKLEVQGYSTTIAHDGRAAWEHAQQTVFDLVMMDYDMPEMNGVDLCRHLRDDRRYDQTPIIMVTGFACELDMAKLSEELKISAFVSKPFILADLIKKVEEVLSACHV